MATRVLSLLVDNTSGVLSRIAGLFSRRGYNIDSITAGVTADPRFTRITIITSGEEDSILEQIEKQVNKLVDVRSIRTLPPESSVSRELVMLKLRALDSDRQAILSVVNIFRAKIIDVAKDSLIIELTGNQSKVDAFISLLGKYEILELARTGITSLSRGSEGVQYFD